MAYYMSGAFGLIVAFLCALTVPEPSRKTIGEEREEEKDENTVASRTVNTKLEHEEKKEDPWKVLLQPRVIMLCIAASIRHTGDVFASFTTHATIIRCANIDVLFLPTRWYLFRIQR